MANLIISLGAGNTPLVNASALFSLIGDMVPNYALISSNKRSVGLLIPDIVIEEMHRDDVSITVHPVETGTPISDHKFENPAVVEMRCGWSDSTHQSAGFVQSVYEELVALKQSTEPFDVSTGKRQYQNMLVKSIVVTTDETTEYVLNALVTLQEIIWADVGAGSGSATNTGANFTKDFGSAVQPAVSSTNIANILGPNSADFSSFASTMGGATNHGTSSLNSGTPYTLPLDHDLRSANLYTGFGPQ